MMKSKIFGLIILVGLLASCGDEGNYTPKPKGYNHIELPTPKYKVFKEDGAPYSIQYNEVALLVDDTAKIAEKYWKKLFYPQYKAEIGITYKEVKNDPKRLDSLIRDSHKLTNKHTVKTDHIKKKSLTLPNGSAAKILDYQVKYQLHINFI